MTGSARLSRRLGDRLSPPLFQQLSALATGEASGIVGETPTTTFWRSVHRLTELRPVGDTSIAGLLDRGGDALLPCPADIRHRIFGRPLHHFERAGHSSGWTFGVPAAFEEGTAINFTHRLWSADGRLVLKLKLGAFFDSRGSLCWEFGVAGKALPPMSALRDGIVEAAEIACAWGATIDLTPSHRRAAALALRLGGRPSRGGCAKAAVDPCQRLIFSRDTLAWT